MTHLTLNLLAAVPATPTWSAGVGLIMVTANLFALVVARYGIKVKGVGPNLPVQLPKQVCYKLKKESSLCELSFFSARQT